MKASNRVVILGLDCAVPHLVFDKWRDELPTFSLLMRSGLYGPLRSTDPPITIPAWTSMVTGKDPGQLGCYGFRNRTDHSYSSMKIADSTFVREPTIWRILSRRRMRSVVIGVPQTYPPTPLRGLMVSGLLTPNEEAEFTYPKEFKEEIHRISGGYLVDVKDFRTDEKDRLLNQVLEMTRRRFRLIRHLLREESWDFFMAVEMGPDRLQHGFWKYFDPQHPKYSPDGPYRDVVLSYYKMLDAELEAVVDLLDPSDTLIVVSDHGARPMMGGVCINEWLRKRGYLVLNGEPEGPTSFSMDMVDWDKTIAWSEGGYYARVFLNIKGREPRGRLPLEDATRFKRDLAHELREMEGPDGRPLGNQVISPEEIYKEQRGVPPDLMVYFGGLSWRSVGSVGTDSIFTTENDMGPDDANHDPFGLIIIHQKDGPLGKGVWRDDLTIYDVAPTVLDLMGVEAPPGLMGRKIQPLRETSDTSALETGEG